MTRRFLFVHLPYFPVERFLKVQKTQNTIIKAWWDREAQDKVEESAQNFGPLVLVSHGVKGTRISAVSPEAQNLGLWLDMKLNDARAMMPELRVETHQHDQDQSFVAHLAQWMQRYSPAVAKVDRYHFALDIFGCAHLFGGEKRMAEDVMKRLNAMGFTSRITIADHFASAHALAYYSVQDIHIAPVQSAPQYWDRLPIEVLRLSEDCVLLLKRLGLKTIGHVRPLPRAALERRFRETQKSIRKRDASVAAQSVGWRLDQLLGVVSEPLHYIQEPSTFRVTKPCPELALEQGAVAIALDDLLPKLCAMLSKAGKGARRYRLMGYRADGGIGVASIMLSAASHETSIINRLFKERLEQIDCGFGIDLFVLDAVQLEAVGHMQNAMLNGEENRTLSPSIHHFVDVVNNHTASQTVRKLAPRTSHVPERAQCFVSVSQNIEWQKWQALQPLWAPRPLRLLERPEAAQVTAELPDSPPAQFIWRKVLRRVIRARGPERILPEWWHDNLKTKRSASFRDYYDVEDDKGLRYWIFRATKDEPIEDSDVLMRHTEWFVHGLF